MILNYSGCAPETAERFRENIIAWKHLADKNSDDEKARKLRLEITKLFNEIYINVFEISCVDQNLPAVIKMFRITSYNVCYTKLLRNNHLLLHAPVFSGIIYPS